MKKIVAAVFLFLSLNSFAEDKPFQTFRFQNDEIVVKGHIWDPNFKNQTISFSVWFNGRSKKHCYFNGIKLADKSEVGFHVKNTQDGNQLGNDKQTTTEYRFEPIDRECNSKKITLVVTEVRVEHEYVHSACSDPNSRINQLLDVNYLVQLIHTTDDNEEVVEKYATLGRSKLLTVFD